MDWLMLLASGKPYAIKTTPKTIALADDHAKDAECQVEWIELGLWSVLAGLRVRAASKFTTSRVDCEYVEFAVAQTQLVKLKRLPTWSMGLSLASPPQPFSCLRF